MLFTSTLQESLSLHLRSTQLIAPSRTAGIYGRKNEDILVWRETTDNCSFQEQTLPPISSSTQTSVCVCVCATRSQLLDEPLRSKACARLHKELLLTTQIDEYRASSATLLDLPLKVILCTVIQNCSFLWLRT